MTRSENITFWQFSAAVVTVVFEAEGAHLTYCLNSENNLQNKDFFIEDTNSRSNSGKNEVTHDHV